jgi:hypothetical protein
VPRKITDEQVEVVITRVLTEKGPGQDTHWSTRSMAGQAGLSQSSVSRISGGPSDSSPTCRDVEAVRGPGVHRDVVGLYMNPPEHALVLAVDEKSRTCPATSRATRSSYATATTSGKPLQPSDPPHRPQAQADDIRRHSQTAASELPTQDSRTVIAASRITTIAAT